MTAAPSKTHKGENFPVASWLLKPHTRAPILTFYHFARAADDIADRDAPAEPRLAKLEHMRASLAGERDDEPLGLALRAIPNGPEHGADLLQAFRQDCIKQRYDSWDDLLGYCRHSAMPVGRFVCDVHREDRAMWPLSDALCAALQVINHLQDCGKDYRELDRVYLPADALAAHGATVAMLAQPAAPPPLRACIVALAECAQGLLTEAAPFAGALRDRRLALEVAVIHRLAVDLCRRLTRADPLSERVHHTKAEGAGLAIRAALRQLLSR